MTQVAQLPTPAMAAAPVRRRTRTRGSLQQFVAPLAGHRRAWLVFNALYAGVGLLAAGYAFVNPALQTELTRAVGEAFSPAGGLGPLMQAYLTGNLLGAMLLTFGVNLVLGSAALLTLPSAIIPFAGILVGLYRAMLWGLLFAPTQANALGPTLLLHIPTIVLEGEAYIVAMLGVWLWWQPVLTSRDARWQAWKRGAVLQLRVYAVVVALLALAAIYESIEVIWLLSRTSASAT